MQGLYEAAEFSYALSLPHEYCHYHWHCRYRLHNGLEFMSLVLSRSSSGHFSVLRDIQIKEKVQDWRSKCIIGLQPWGGNAQPQQHGAQSYVGELGCGIRKIIRTELLGLGVVQNGLSIHQQNPLPQYLLIIAISFGPCTYYNFTTNPQTSIVGINFKSYVNKILVNKVKDLDVTSIQVPEDIYSQSRDTIKGFHRKVKRAIKMKGQHQRQVYIIGPTRISEKNRVVTILSYIETCNQQKSRMAVCVHPSNIEEYEPFDTLNGHDLHDYEDIRLTCGNTFNIKVQSWAAPRPPNPGH